MLLGERRSLDGGQQQADGKNKKQKNAEISTFFLRASLWAWGGGSIFVLLCFEIGSCVAHNALQLSGLPKLSLNS